MPRLSMMLNEKFTPYIGAGINYTIFNDVDDGQFVDVDYGDAFGTLIQVGFDYDLTERWTVNLDIKRLYLDTDVKIDAGELDIIKTRVDIDPLIIGLGICYRF